MSVGATGRVARTAALVASLALCSFVSACGSVGAASIRGGRPRYNGALQETADQQLLLNLVRLRFGHTPVFLQVTSLTSQISVGANASLLPAVRPAGGELAGQIGATLSEVPTVTYVPLQGEDYANQLLSRLPESAIIQLLRAGWPLDMVFRICLHKFSDAHNTRADMLPSPAHPGREKKFEKIVENLQILYQKDLVDITFARNEESDAADKGDAAKAVPPGPVTPKLIIDWISQAANKLVDRLTARRDVPKDVRLVLSLDLEARTKCNSPETCQALQSIMEELKLSSGKQYYDLVSTRPNKAAGDTDDGPVTITMTTRSVLEVMQYLTRGIESPTHAGSCDVADFCVHASGHRPTGCAVSVQYRGGWFCIDESDATSKAAFLLLTTLLGLQGAKPASAGPVLTLPAGL